MIQAALTWPKRAPGCVNTTFFEHHGIKRTYITSEGHNENAITDISMFSYETAMLRDYHTTCSRAAFLIHHFQQHFHFFRHTDSRECTQCHNVKTTLTASAFTYPPLSSRRILQSSFVHCKSNRHESDQTGMQSSGLQPTHTSRLFNNHKLGRTLHESRQKQHRDSSSVGTRSRDGRRTNTAPHEDNGTRPAWDRECACETGVGSCAWAPPLLPELWLVGLCGAPPSLAWPAN